MATTTSRSVAWADQIVVMLRESPGMSTGEIAQRFQRPIRPWNCCLPDGHECPKHPVRWVRCQNSDVRHILKRLERQGVVFHTPDPTINRHHWWPTDPTPKVPSSARAATPSP